MNYYQIKTVCEDYYFKRIFFNNKIDDQESFMDKLEIIRSFFFLIKNQINSSKI